MRELDEYVEKINIDLPNDILEDLGWISRGMDKLLCLTITIVVILSIILVIGILL